MWMETHLQKTHWPEGVWLLYTDLVGQSLRGRVADATAVWDAHQFGAEF